MNRIFKSIWNARTRTFVAVSELTNARGKATTVGQSAIPDAAHRWTLRPLYAVLLGAGLTAGSVALAQQISIGDQPQISGSSIVFTGAPGSIQFQNGGSITGLNAGALSASSSDAVTGAQLFQVNMDLDGRVVGLRTDLTSFGTDLTTLTGRVTTTEGNLSGITTRVANTEGNLSGITTRVTDAEGNLSGVTTRVTTAEQNVDTLTTRVTGTEGNVATVTGRVESLEEQLFATGDGVKYFRVNSTLDDSSAAGENALAAGALASASGVSATAIGHAAAASGANSIALGTEAMVSETAEGGIALGQRASAGTTGGAVPDGVASIAIGRDSQAGGDRSIAVGDGATVNSPFVADAVAIGTDAQVTGITSQRAIALGTGARAGNADTTALGANANAGSAGATAIGANARAQADSAIAIGDALASGSNAVAAGNGARALTANSIALGTGAGVGTVGNAAGDRTSHIAIGTNAGQNVVGNQTTAVGWQAGNQVVGDWNVAIGTRAGGGIQGDENTAVGYDANQGNGEVAHATAVGARTRAGSDAVAIGYQANAVSKGSVALGSGAAVTSGQSVAIGDRSLASGGNIALGEGSRATAADATGTGYLTNQPFSGTVVSVGRTGTADAGIQRRIVNVAPGARGTDAVNVDQLGLSQQQVANLAGVALNNDGSFGKITINTAANGSNPGGTVEFNTFTEALQTLSSGDIDILPTDAVRFNPQNQINGVARGTLATDAVNVEQLDESIKSNSVKYFAVNSRDLANERNTGAQGSNAIAIGAEAQAGGTSGLAAGYQARAEAGNATSVGAGTQALAAGSSAVGNRSFAYDEAGVAIGQQAISRGQNSLVIGTGAQADPKTSTASVDNAIVIGTSAEVTAQDGTAIGHDALTSDVRGIAQGTNAHSSAADATAIGTNARSSGVSSNAIGNAAISSGLNANAMGAQALASGSNAQAFGTNARAHASRAIALGDNATSGRASTATPEEAANNRDTTAIGTSALANARNATALGREAQATGINALAIGDDTRVEAQLANAVGSSNRIGTNATGSTTAGNNNNVLGGNANVLGSTNTVTGGNANVVGNGNEVTSANANVLGNGNRIAAANSGVLGNGNELTVQNAFIIGNNGGVQNAGGVALGSNSQSTTGANQPGYVPNTGSAAAAGRIAGTVSTTGAIAVGSDTVRRQITGLAAGTADTDAVNVAQLRGTGWNVRTDGDAATHVSTGEGHTVDIGLVPGETNLTVSRTSANGQTVIDYALAKNLDLGSAGSVRTGNTTVNNAGVTINNGGQSTQVLGGSVNVANGTGSVSMNGTGQVVATNGTNTVTVNGATGTVTGLTNRTFTPGTIVNGRAATEDQLGQLNTQLTNAGFGILAADGQTARSPLGQTIAIVEGDGNVTTRVVDGEVQLSLNDDVDVANNLSVGGSASVAGPLTVAGNTDLQGDVGVAGNTSMAGTLGVAGLSTLTGGAVIGNRLTVNPNTTISMGGNRVNDVAAGLADTDAVNVSQLNTLAARPLTFTGNTGSVDRVLGETLAIEGGLADTAQASGDNLRTQVVGDTVQLEMAENLASTSLTIRNGGPRIDAQGIAMNNTQITGLAAGSADDHAVNLAQLRDVQDTAELGWNLGANGAAATQVAPGATVDLSNTDGNIVVTQDGTDVAFNLADDVAVANDLTVGGAASIQGPLTVAGNTNLQGNLEVVGNTNLQGDLGVAGNSTMQGNLGVVGDTDLQGDLAVAGNSTVQGTLGVAGLSTLTGGAVIGNSLTVNPNTTISMGGNRVNDVAAGLADTDAVNVSQLNTLAARPLTFTGNTGSVDRVLGETLAIEGGLANTAQASGENLRTQVVGDTVQLQMAENLASTSLTIRNGGPRIDAQGIAMNDTQITGLAAGSADDHAVNLAQLRDVQDTAELGWNLGANGAAATQVAPGGTVDLSNTDGNIVVTQNGTDVAFDLADDVAIDNDLTVGGATSVAGPLTVAGNTDLQGSLAVAGNSTLQGTLGVAGLSTLSGGAVIGNSLTVNPSTTISMGGNRVNDVAAGLADTDAVNVSQLNTLAARPLTFTGNTGSVDRVLGETLAIEGGLADTAQASGENLRTRVVGETMQLEMAENLASTSLTIRNGGPRIDAQGIAMNNTQITGLAAGSADDHAVNLSQLREVQETAELGWNLGTNGDPATQVAPGTTVDLSNTDGNIVVTQDGTDVAFDLADDVAIANDLTVGGAASVEGPLTVAGDTSLQGNLEVAGNTSLQGDLGVAGNTNLQGDLDVVGNTNLQGDLGVAGNSTMQGNLGVVGDTDLQGDLAVAGNSTVQGTLGVTGLSTLSGGAVIGNSLTVNPNTTISMGGNRVNDVAAGVDDTDAVNVSQLNTIANRPLTFTGNTGSVDRVLGETLAIEGGLADTAQASGDNLRTRVVGETVQLEMAEDLTSTSLTIRNGGPRIDAQGIAMNNTQITGLAAGSEDDHAVNVSQLREVQETAELGWNLGTNGDPATQVSPGTDVMLDNTDGNIVLTQEGTDVTFDLADDVVIANDLTVGGAASVQGPLTVAGDTALQGALDVTGDTTLQGELAVVGDTDLQGDLGVAGNTALQGNLAVAGNTTMQGNLGVTGLSTLSGGVVIGNSLTVDPDTTISMGGNRINHVAPGVADTDAVNVSQLNDLSTRPVTYTGNTGSVELTLGQTLAIEGSLSEAAAASSDNLRTRVIDAKVMLELAEDLNVSSVAIRNGGPRMDAQGIAMAGQQITGLAAGTQGDHAVNLSQLRDVQDTAQLGWNLGTNGGAATNVAPGASVDFSSADGNIGIDQSGTAVRLRLADNIAINNNLTVGGDTVINGYTTLAGGMVVSSQFNVTGGTIVNMGGNRIQNVGAGVADTDAVNVGQLNEVKGGVDRLNDRAVVYDGNVGDSKNRVTLQGDTSTDGGRTGGTTITNLARGEVSATSTDAINGSQLHEVGTDVASGMGGNSTFVDGRLVTELNVGGNTYTNVNDALVGVDAKVDTVSNVANRGWDLQVNGDTASQVAPGSTVQFVEGENVTITRDGLNVTVDVARDISVDSVKAKEVQAETVRTREMAIENGPTINQRGLDMVNQRIQNVADGVAPGDAVNLGQLNRLGEGMSQQVNRLDGRINLAEKRADGGTAAAMATAGLPQAYLPGKSMFAIGGGAWNGESGFAMGLSTVSDNGKWVVKGSGATSSRGDFGGSVGVGYQW